VATAATTEEALAAAEVVRVPGLPGAPRAAMQLRCGPDAIAAGAEHFAQHPLNFANNSLVRIATPIASYPW
jgi:hypothetical protein